MRDRIKALATKSAPTMVPGAREVPPPPEKEEEVVPAISDLITDRKERIRLARLISQYGELGVQKSIIKKAQEKLAIEIKTALGNHQIAKAISGEWYTNYYSSPRPKLMVDKLKQQGVTTAQILAATVTKDCYTLRITKIGEGEEEEEE